MPPARLAAGFRLGRTFDAPLILAQIICLQACIYTLLCILTLVATWLFLPGTAPHLDHILAHTLLTPTTSLGILLTGTHLATTMLASVLLLWIVGRARLCLDFSITFHVLHLLCTYVHTSYTVPASAFFYLIQLVSVTIMSAGGEYLCMRWEMEPIVLGGGAVVADSHPRGVQVSLGGSGGNRDASSLGSRITSRRWKRKTSLAPEESLAAAVAEFELQPMRDSTDTQDKAGASQIIIDMDSSYPASSSTFASRTR